MYSQSYNPKPTQHSIIAFPNKDSILQMKALEAKCESNEQKTTLEKASLFTTSDNLLVLVTIMSITDDENLVSAIFTIIAGILFTM